MNSKGGVIFGVKSPTQILSVIIEHYDQINRIPPTYTHFVYADSTFKDLMFSRLYFGEHIDEYKEMGLNNVNWSKMKYFELDRSFEEGFVKTWKINYDGVDYGSD
jgi:hypothetical protein